MAEGDIKMNFASRLLWGAYGHLYDGLLRFYPYRDLTQQVNDWVSLKPGETVLDLGCGTGNELKLLMGQRDVFATGIDISPTMLAVARRKLRRYVDSGSLQLMQGNLAKVIQNIPTHSVDCIVSINVFYALTVEERAVIWKEATRVIKPGGRMVIASSTKTGSWGLIREHLRNASWLDLLSLRLLGVFVIDSIINLFGDVGQFEFPDEHILRKEAEAVGAKWIRAIRCYGGPVEGVDVLFELRAP